MSQLASPNEPDWVDKMLRQNWTELTRRLSSELLPAGRAKQSPKALGCGYYGCVYATSAKDVVLKEAKHPASKLVLHTDDARGSLVDPIVLRAAMAWASTQASIQTLIRNPMSRRIGQALRLCLDKDVLVSDVHPGNVGIVTRRKRDREKVWVITDPGHVIFLGAERPEFAIETLGDLDARTRVAARRAVRP
jgi:glycine/D-amino acid oxidase-like deaminating enzyme